MKIVVVTQEEPFYLPLFMQRMAERRAKDIVAMVILSPASGKGGWRKTIQRHLMLYGWWDFLKQSLRFVTYKLIDRLGWQPNGRFYSIRRVAHHYNIPIYTPQSINDESFLAQLRGLEPDVVVSSAAPQIFRKGILSLPKHGCINVHSALLPKYRGMLPSFWVLTNGETETGVTVHYMDEKLDNGEILAQRRVSIAPDETQHSLLMKTKTLGAELVLEVLDQIENGTVSPQPNNAEEATYFSFPTPEDVRRFRAQGKRFR
jgi:methionyl-tRNA formyltransferase